MPKRRAGRVLVEVEEIELRPEPTMVTRTRLLESLQVRARSACAKKAVP